MTAKNVMLGQSVYNGWGITINSADNIITINSYNGSNSNWNGIY